MGLKYPADVAAWQRWQNRQHWLRQAVHGTFYRGTPASTACWVSVRNEEAPSALIVLESAAASSRLSLLEPLQHLDGVPTAVVTPYDPTPWLPSGWVATACPDFEPATQFPAARTILSASHYLGLGAAAWAHAQARGHTYATMQHGLLTPFAPPLPHGSALLAWTRDDAEFWCSGRTDIEVSVVGSALLWEVAQRPQVHASRFATPLFLGQLHAAELPRAGLIRATTESCWQTGAHYRPHPSEKDIASRLQHRVWQRLGVTVDDAVVPLSELTTPVVSVFSTGILEAAARGLPAWAYYPGAPAWLGEFWERYGMSRWGSAPTPAPPTPDAEPARAVAAWIKEHA